MRFLLLSCALTIALAGCTTLPTKDEVKTADYGAYPEDYEAIVKAYYNKTLNDPDATLYQSITKPQRYWLGNEMDAIYYGHLVCVTLNVKNMFGGYKGYTTDAMLIRNGTVLKYVEDAEWWGEKICPPKSL